MCEILCFESARLKIFKDGIISYSISKELEAADFCYPFKFGNPKVSSSTKPLVEIVRHLLHTLGFSKQSITLYTKYDVFVCL